MVNSKVLLILTVLITAGAVALFFFFQTDEAKIKKQYQSIARIIEKKENENPVISASKANKIKKKITDPCRVTAPYFSLEKTVTADELSSYIFQGRSYYKTISVKFYDFIIEFPDEGVAFVDLTADMNSSSKSGENFENIQELRCQLKEIDDTWILNEIEIVEVLEK